MKLTSRNMVAVALILAGGLLTCMFGIDAAMAAGSAAHSPHGFDLGQMAMAVPLGLVALRQQVDSLTARAAAKLGEIKDGMEPDAIRAIEEEHSGILGEIEQTRARIVTAEAEEAARAAPATPASTQPPVNIAGQVYSALAADRQRASEIREICRRSGADEATTQRYIDESASVQAVREQEWDRLVARSDAHRVWPQASTDHQDETVTRRMGMAEAIAARMQRAGGDRNASIPDRARAYGEMSLVEMAAECIGWRGHMRTAREATEIFQRAFHTTSDFPAIFSQALNTRLLARYEAAAPTYRRWAARYTTPDFRPTNVIRAGDFPSLQPVNEAGEIKSGTFSESKETLQTKAYGVMLSVTRVMLINDQLGAIDQVLSSAGDRIGDWENNIAYAALLSNSGAGPTLLTDNKAVFHTDHKNLAAAGTAIDADNIGKGRAAMMKQKTLDGITANFKPVTLLTGPDKLTEAEKLLATIFPAQQSNVVPDSLKRLIPIDDANITGNSWYLFADPAVAPVFHYGYLEGFEGPRLSSMDVFDVQGTKFKLEHDFGVAATDYRGGYRNQGA